MTIFVLNYEFFPAVTKGISANMMKVSSKRRRTRAEILADK